MQEYRFSIEDTYSGIAIPKGIQEKYYKDGYYYKLDTLSNDGYVEYLISTVLKHSTLDKGDYVEYEYCKINGRTGSRSKGFLGEDEQFLTMQLLHKRLYYGIPIEEAIYGLEFRKRIDYIGNMAGKVGISREIFEQHIKITVQLDWMLLNVDRNWSNIGVIYNRNTKECRMAPIFDNAMTLNRYNDLKKKDSMKEDSRKEDSMKKASIKRTTPNENIALLGCTTTPAFRIDYIALNEELNTIEEEYGKHEELDMLRKRLNLHMQRYERKILVIK